MREDTAYLHIVTWVGFCGIHYYGSIWFQGKRKEVRWIPYENQRKMLNDYTTEKFLKLKKGDHTIRFLREGDLETGAIRQYKKMFPGANRLVKGNPLSIYDDFPETDILDGIRASKRKMKGK